jgi:arginine-tRNA-protein transferase
MIRGDNIKLTNYAPRLMDKLLSIGYFRSGKSMFHGPVTFIEGVPNSTIRTRLVLETQKLGKSSRKLLAKNRKRFTHQVCELDLDQEILDLYEDYRTHCFKGNLNGELSEWLEGSFDMKLFNTKIIKFYDGERLIAASFVDIGLDSMASIMGIYHPDYSKYSLGVYSMLVEVECAKEMELDYYYPGYILSASPRFEYKKKVGNLDYKSFDSLQWKSEEDLDEDDYFVEKTMHRLEDVKESLAAYKIDAEIYAYPLFTWSTYPINASLLEQYFFLRVSLDLFDTLHIIVVYDIARDGFIIHLVNSIGQESTTWKEFENYYPSDGNWLDTVLIQSSSRLENDVTLLPILIITMLKSITDRIKPQ